jgi:hypothetical protein
MGACLQKSDQSTHGTIVPSALSIADTRYKAMFCLPPHDGETIWFMVLLHTPL